VILPHWSASCSRRAIFTGLAFTSLLASRSVPAPPRAEHGFEGDIDAKMSRTANRPIRADVSRSEALTFGTTLAFFS